jgi:hypothetical protein
LKSLHEHFDRNTLPVQLGGTLDWDEAVDKDIVEKILQRNTPYEGTQSD